MKSQMKISHLKNFLNLSLQATDSLRAQKNLQMAEKLMAEVEAEALSYAGITEEIIAGLVALSRSPLWNQAQARVKSLRSLELQGALAA